MLWTKTAEIRCWALGGDRFHHAGLSASGQYFFCAEAGDSPWGVFETSTGALRWTSDETAASKANARLVSTSKDFKLPELIVSGHLCLDCAGLSGNFSITGLHYNHPILHDQISGCWLEIDHAKETVAIFDSHKRNGQLIGPLFPDADWLYATFAASASKLVTLDPEGVVVYSLEPVPES